MSAVTRIRRLWLAALATGLLMPGRGDADVVFDEMFSPAMGENMRYSVYTPPDWREGEALPLVMLLHGGGDDERSFSDHSVDAFLDGEIAAGRVPRVVIVNPDGGFGFWENWVDGSRHYRDWVMRDLLPRVRARFGTLPCPVHCHVMGMSMGAHGALRFAYFEGDSFRTVTVISGMILKREEVKPTLRRRLLGWFIPFKRIWGDIDDPASAPRDLDPYVAWTENEDVRELHLYLAWGTGDGRVIRKTSERFRQRLDDSGLEFHWNRYDGRHKWVDWKYVIADALKVQLPSAPPPEKEGGASAPPNTTAR